MPHVQAPGLVLAAAYWLHMLATVVWIGGLSALSLIVLPAARKALEPPAFQSLMARMQTRLQGLGWFSLLVLGGTGMFQMSASPSYDGFLAITNPWARAILAKHLVIGLMVLASIYLTWGLLPAIQRMALLRAAGKNVDEAQAARLHKRESTLLALNLALSVLVLALTALARAAG
jgi:uncharacterized membrane protein